MKDLFAREALAQIPKILTLLDRNAHSPTYGCFDRNFWHYKIIDFPSGMSQEFVWPLALALTCDAPENPFFQRQVLREWIEAGILFAARSAHPDGACDDYFPFEKAGGAAAFSLLACVESYTLLGLSSEEMLRFFHLRATWLARHHESGRLTNHQALIVLCLEKVGRLLSTTVWDKAKEKRLNRVLKWQDDEGWFQEYEGADPGYHTLTIGLLAQIYELLPSDEIKVALEKAVAFAAEFVHPDGSFGGEYTSRNTYNFFPHGFELVARWLPSATAINDQILKGLQNGLAPCFADDHIIGHHTWSYLLAWKNFAAQRAAIKRPADSKIFKNAGLLIERGKGRELYLALNKGGALKFFRDQKLVASDTHLSLLVKDGKKLRNAVGHLVGKYNIRAEADEITISGKLGWAKTKQMTTFNLMVLRLIMFCGGRFFPNLVRKLLQGILITGKKSAPFSFERKITWGDAQLRVIDTLKAKTWEHVEAAGIGAAQTSIYVVMSRTFQAGQMQPWLDLTEEVRGLPATEPLRVERTF